MAWLDQIGVHFPMGIYTHAHAAPGRGPLGAVPAGDGGLVVAVSMLVAVVVVVLEEEVLVGAVGSEGDGRDAQAGQGVLEPVPPAEDAGIAPGLTVPGGDVTRGSASSFVIYFF